MSANVGVNQLQRRNHSRTNVGRKAGTTIITIVMIFVAAYFLLPLVGLLISTTKTGSELFNTPMLALPKHIGLFANLKLVSTYHGGYFWRWYLNSAIYATVTSVLSTVICSLAGYALAKYRFRARQFVFGMILASLLVPAAALTVPTFLMVKFLGLMNTYAGVIVPGLATAFGVYFLSIYIGEAMPTEFMDSGRVDGAGEWQIFWRIAIPVLRPGMVTYLLISFIGSWNNFFLPLLILNSSALYPLPLGLDVWSTYLTQAGAGVPPYAQIVTGSFLSILPMVVLFPFLRKYIASGMITGGIKM